MVEGGVDHAWCHALGDLRGQRDLADAALDRDEVTVVHATQLGVGVGALGSVPDQFARNLCGPLGGWEAEAWAARRIVSALTVEAALSLSGSLSATCEAADLNPNFTGTVTARDFGDGMDAQPYASSSVRLAFEPPVQGSLGLRAGLGGGRIWAKDVWYWSGSLGLRIGGGQRGVLVEVERRAFNLDFVAREQTWVDGLIVSQSPEDTASLDESIWVVRVRIGLKRF